jgi:predicted dehydrogenase
MEQDRWQGILKRHSLSEQENRRIGWGAIIEKERRMSQGTNRRDFMKVSTLAGVAAALGLRSAARGDSPSGEYRSPSGFSAAPLDQVRMGFVGIGLQGGWHVRNFLKIDGVEIKALCDIDEPRAREVREWVKDAGKPAPELYTRGDTDYRRLCERDDIDLVFNATPWRWHVPVCIEAMETGKHTAVEVPAAYTVDGCWNLVETAERTRLHCVMMENCCYGRRELMILNMVRRGLLGELLHAEGAYIHDLRSIKFSDKNEGLWRLEHSIDRNGNLYPTHGIGPLAQCLDINRGDQFDFLVSMSSKARGLDLFAEQHLSPDDPRRRHYSLGDMNSTLIRTQRGRSILLQHDTTSPRPYSRINLVQGTRGTVTGYPDRIYIEGRSPEHEWEALEAYRDEFEHPLWSELEEAAQGAGHGGMDFLEDYRLIQSLRSGTPTDMDVYDAAAWSVLCELTETSVADRSKPVDVPDFTRGGWKRNHPLAIVSSQDLL